MITAVRIITMLVFGRKETVIFFSLVQQQKWYAFIDAIIFYFLPQRHNNFLSQTFLYTVYFLIPFGPLQKA